MIGLSIIITITLSAESKTNTELRRVCLCICVCAQLSSLPDAQAHIYNLDSGDRLNKHEVLSIGRGKMKVFSCGNER